MATTPTQVKTASKAPPRAIVDAIALQIVGALDAMKPPEYVSDAARAFVVSLERWSDAG